MYTKYELDIWPLAHLRTRKQQVACLLGGQYHYVCMMILMVAVQRDMRSAVYVRNML
ncbi:hypothetical protein IJGMMPBP_00049 [Infectious spleen and kidney necrosis virus]|uniref:ORF049R n=3 Tax=Infectious spleen and kidney necrosis virus TaxID=180170 RepID=Q8QUR1_ISKNN|nr:ORF049R [Infectious spleen and kidney necrosis virus]QIQ54492.1 ORF048 [Angelfish iridovirus AFIV-16]QJC63401.1 hypothetical protein [Banggai cardinalfish iridovirus]WEP24586.1 hypothetical protein ORF047R [Largemouth bass ulcerative syndrome virus]AAL98773.1 ORF049R [Infectious spleen and kidney necrosis virus]QOE77187.1 hypothetical protein [Banggai cardinalfish iridovirus]